MFTKFKPRDPNRSRARRAVAWTALTIFSLGLSGQALAASPPENPVGRRNLGFPGRD